MSRSDLKIIIITDWLCWLFLTLHHLVCRIKKENVHSLLEQHLKIEIIMFKKQAGTVLYFLLCLSTTITTLLALYFQVYSPLCICLCLFWKKTTLTYLRYVALEIASYSHLLIVGPSQSPGTWVTPVTPVHHVTQSEQPARSVGVICAARLGGHHHSLEAGKIPH